VFAFEVDKARVRIYENRDKLEFLGYEMRRKIECTLRDLTKYEPILFRLPKTPDVVDTRVASYFRRRSMSRIAEGLSRIS